MAEPSFQQKKDWARGKNLEPAPAKPTRIQSLWASRPGRLVQGSLIDDAMGLAQMAVRMEDPVIPLRMGQPDPYRDAAVNAVDGWVSEVERNYRDARIAAGQDVTGIDGARFVGGLLSPTRIPKLKAATSLAGKAFQGGATAFGESIVKAPVDTQTQSYGQGKLESAAKSAVAGAAWPFAKAGLAKIVDPKIGANTRGLLDQGVPLTVGQTLGGATQRLENRLASLPVVGAPIRVAQERAMESAYPGLMKTLNAGGNDVFSDLRPFPSPVAIDRGATGFMADMAYSQPVQTALRTVVGGERSQAAGIIGEYLRDEIGKGALVRGLLTGPR